MEKIIFIKKIIVLGILSCSLMACLPVPYETKTACEKQTVMWDKIVASEYKTLPAWQGTELLPLVANTLFQQLGIIKDAVTNYLNITMNHQADEFPAEDFLQPQRTKVFHAYGSVAKAKFVSATDNPFTGLFKGVPCGLVRVSLAAAPSDLGIAPGIAVKWFIDGKPSGNFVSLHSLEEQAGFNFFKNNFSNYIPEPSNFLLAFAANVLRLVSSDPFKIDVSYLAKTTAQGSTATVVDAPVQLILKPNTGLSFSVSKHEVRNDFKNIAANTLLYRIYGMRKNSTTEIYVGDIVTTSNFVASEYGDKELFFRHETIDGKL